jgi:clan AA aspartic protease
MGKKSMAITPRFSLPFPALVNILVAAEGKKMGLVHTEITLKNGEDITKVKMGLMPKQGIRRVTVNALVDSGAWTLVINESTRKKLGLEAERVAPGILADGTKSMYKVIGPLEIAWKDRFYIGEALVVPEAKENLLGAIPLEALDLTINPRTEQVVGAHGDEIMHMLA